MTELEDGALSFMGLMMIDVEVPASSITERIAEADSVSIIFQTTTYIDPEKKCLVTVGKIVDFANPISDLIEIVDLIPDGWDFGDIFDWLPGFHN